MHILRLYEDAAGESHFDLVPVDLELRDAAPPAKPVFFSKPTSASWYGHVRCPVGWDGQQHAAPQRQVLICTSGLLRMTTSLGDAREIGPGTAVLVEDTSGKGHASEVVSETAFEAIVIRLE